MKYQRLIAANIVGFIFLGVAVGFFYYKSNQSETSEPALRPALLDSNEEAQRADLMLVDRQGEAPNVTSGIPHVQLDQTSGDVIYEKLAAQTYAMEGVLDSASQASLPGARAIAVAPELPVNQDAIIVGREFAHIHADPGRGSLHAILAVNDAAEVVEKGWGTYHPFALDGSKPGMVMVFAPRDDLDLGVINRILKASFDFAVL